jgi:uncharacterized repeat protein (TIGR01451 family)
MKTQTHTYRFLSFVLALSICLSLAAIPTRAAKAMAAGISDYYIPTNSAQIAAIFVDNDNDTDANPDLVDEDQGMHYVIGLTAYVDNTVVYYDHWENGYGFDKDTFTGADESYSADQGDVMSFISYNVPVTRLAAPNEPIGACGASSINPAGTTTNCYDGGDHIYVTGGVAATLTVWPESVGTAYSLSWGLYPTKPYQTTYTIPVGENLTGYLDFSNTYVIVQSTTEGNLVTIDDPKTPGLEVSETLGEGEVTELYHIDSGTLVSAAKPVQTLYIAGRYHGTGDYSLELRGFTSIPTNMWGNEYFNPVSGRTGGNGTDLYIYNPGSAQTITWQDLSGSGSFTIGASATLAYSDAAVANHKVPVDSGVRLSGTGNFNVIGSADTEAGAYEWGFNLIPSGLLANEYFLGWAPGTRDDLGTPTNNCSPVWITATQNNTAVNIDYSPADGNYETTLVLDQLESVRVYDPDYNNTGMNLVGNGPFAAAWGEAGLNQGGSACGGSSPNMDLGYTVVPYLDDFVDIVLDLDKTADPTLILNEVGQVSEFTLAVSTDTLAVNDVDVIDTLPDGWAYVDDSTTITFSNDTTLTGNAADPTSIVGQVLTWDLNENMPVYETLTIVFEAITTTAPGGSSVNKATASGVSGGLDFVAMDNATVNISDIQVEKESNVTGLLERGDFIDYTLTLTNISLFDHNAIVVRDPLPAGTSYVAGSTVAGGTLHTGGTYLDQFGTANYNNSDGTLTWSSGWTEGDQESIRNPGNSPTTGYIQITGGQLRFHQTAVYNPYSIKRAANLADATSATLTCTITPNAYLEDDDTLTVAVSPDGGTTWIDLETIHGNVTGTHYINEDISAYANANTQIRFSANNILGTYNTEYMYVDNVQIEWAYDSTVVKDNITGGTYPDLADGVPEDLVEAGDAFSLPAGESMTVTYRVQVNNPLELGLMGIENEAYVSHADDPRESKGSVMDALDVIDVSLDGSASDETPEMGTNVTFTLHIANPTGFQAANNLTITDVVPTGYTYVAGSIAGGTSRNDSSPAGTGLSWTINSLTAGSGTDLTYQATVLASGTYNNYAEISAYGQYDYDSHPGNGQQTPDEDDDDTVVMTVFNSPAVEVSTSTDISEVDGAGDVIHYTVSIENVGDVTLNNVSVADPVIAYTYSSGDSDSDNKLDIDETWIYTGSYTVSQAEMDAGTALVTTVSVNTNRTGPDSDSTTINIDQNPALNVDASSNVTEVDAAGDIVNITVEAENTGNISLTGINTTGSDISLTYASGDLDSDGILDVTETWVYTGSYTVTQADMDAGGTLEKDLVVDAAQTLPDTYTVEVTIVQDADMLVTFTALPTNANAADEVINYTMTVENTGNVSLTGITLADDPDINLAYASGDLDSDGILDVTETWTYTGSHTITQAEMDAGTAIHTEVTVDTAQTVEATYTNDVTIAQDVDMLVTFTALPTEANAADETINYTVTVENTGNVSLTGITLADDPDIDLTHVSGDLDSDGILDVDETWTYTGSHTMTQAEMDAGTAIHTEVTVDTAQTDEATYTNDVTIVQDVDMLVTFTALPTDANAADETINYTVTVENTGNVSLTGITLADDPDINLAYASGDLDSDGILDVTETWTYTGSHTMTQAEMDAGTAIHTEVTVDTAQTVEATYTNDVTIVQDADMLVTFTALPTDANAADEVINYTVTVENTGNVSLTGITLADDPDISLAYASGDLDTDGILDVDETWTYTGSHTMTQAEMDAGTAIHTEVTVDTAQTVEATYTNDVTIVQDADMLVTFTALPTDANAAGETINYTVTVENTGNVSLTGITLADDPDISLAYASGDLDTDGILDVDETWTYTGSHTMTQAEMDAGTAIHTEVTVDTAQTDEATYTSDISINQNASVLITMSSDVSEVATAGTEITYTIEIENNGNVSQSGLDLDGNPALTYTLVSGDTDLDGVLDVGETWIYTASYTVSQEEINAGDPIHTEVTVDTDQTDPVSRENDVTIANVAPTTGVDTYGLHWSADNLDVDAGEGVLANDSDANSNPITAVLESDVTHGTLTLDNDGSFSYTPEDGYHGPADSFTYRADDGITTSDPVMVTIEFTNGLPNGVEDGYETIWRTQLTVDAANGILINDSDPDGDPYEMELVAAPAAGQGDLTLNEEDGSFVFMPGDHFHGNATFTYRLYDGHDYCAPVTVTIFVRVYQNFHPVLIAP